MTFSHSLDRLGVEFDDHRVVGDAGLVLPATLMQHLGLEELFGEHVNLGAGEAGANVGRKALTVIASVLAGGDCIDDVGALRAAGCEALLGHEVAAPSTVGIFLRGFTWGHARQLDGVSRELLKRAFEAGAGPGDGALTVDLDSTICETYGLLKEGGTKFTYNHVRGYHPLLAVVSGSGDVCHSRLRGGPANAGKGAPSFVRETISRIRAAGSTGQVTMRMDSGFYSHGVVQACRKADVRYSVTIRLQPVHKEAISQIPKEAWVPIPYFLDGAEVAETEYIPFRDHHANKTPVRLIVRRVRPTPGSQLDLFGREFTHHAFITDRAGGTLELEADHRRHAEVENAIRDLKYGVGLNHMPSGKFGANAAWLALNVMAHNVARWVSRLGLGEALVTTKRLRRRMFSASGSLTRSGRQLFLHLPRHWPWAAAFLEALARLRLIRAPLVT